MSVQERDTLKEQVLNGYIEFYKSCGLRVPIVEKDDETQIGKAMRINFTEKTWGSDVTAGTQWHWLMQVWTSTYRPITDRPVNKRAWSMSAA